jgi:GT2 family glycosyltransferase/SAM-dependent methyltransferase
MDFTGERYVPEVEGQIRYEHLHRYALCLGLVAGKSVLDIASGEGYGAALLATTAGSVTGVDVDPATVEHARHAYYNPRLKFLTGSCESIPLPDASVDVVTSFETIEHHDKHDEMLDEIKRVLKPGGKLIISSPNRLTYSDEPGYKNPFHVKELYYDEFHELLRHRFKSIRIFGQRLAAGSFVFPLETSGATNLTPLTGDATRVLERTVDLPSPIYFVAICSDDAAIETSDISSVYFDRSDDLLKSLERERVHDVQQMQDQVRRMEEEFGGHKSGYEAEIVRQKTGYEAEIARLINEIAAVHAGYQAELKQRDTFIGELENAIASRDLTIADRDRELLERGDALDQLRANWLVSEKNIRDHQANIHEYRKLLSEAQAELSRHIEVRNWIYASRSWRISRSMRHMERLKERGPAGIFQGELELPPSPISDSIDIRGWARSSAGPVVLVEAFLDDFFLGRIRYGEVRPEGYSERISLHGLNLTGMRTLRIRVHDQKGNKQVYTQPVVIGPAAEHPSAAPAAPKEVFHEGWELPEKDATVTGSVEIRGWAYSREGQIVFIEAFLNHAYMGRVAYGNERPDVVSAFPFDAPLRCGFSRTFPVSVQGPAVLELRFIDEKGDTKTLERSITVGAVYDRAQSEIMEKTGGHRPPLQLEELIAEFQSRMGRDPSILDWNSGVDIARAFPQLAVFSPPTTTDTLPYLDHTIDIVTTSFSDDARIAEARRVASVVFVQFTSPETLDVEWRELPAETELQTTSIIIPVHNELSYTQSCLDELKKTLPHNFRGEIIVVDDASTDETPGVLKRYAAADSRIKVLRNAENAGFIASCNRGAQEAEGEILVFLNNDTLPMPGWLPPLLRVLREKPDAGAVGGKLIYPDGTLQEAGGVIFCDASGCNFGKHDTAPNAPLYSFLREVDYCSGALLATRRALFLDRGGFDARFKPAYYEDSDYCFDLRARGYRVYYQPESVVVHFEGASSGTDVTKGIKSYQVVNRAKFAEKWKDALKHQPPPPARYDAATMQDLVVARSVATGNGK